LEGTVVDRVSSQGILGATVLLTGIADNRIVSLTTKAKAGGAFVFEKIPASSGYWLVAMHGDDHVKTIYRQRGLNGIGAQIPVGVSQQIRDVRLEMLPTGGISGRVLDANEKGLSDAQVLIMKADYQEGVRLLRAARGMVRTNRRGQYRVSGLAPGQYYVRVAMPRMGFEVDPGIFSDAPRLRDRALPFTLPFPLRNLPEKESEGYPLIFFPGVADEHAARAVDLRAGGHVNGVDIVVFKVRTRRVRGTIVNMATGTVVPKAEVLLFRRNSARGAPPARTATSADGSFDLRNILPGSYIMVGMSSDGQTPSRGAIALDIRDADVNNLRVPLTAGHDLSGRVFIEAAGRSADELLNVVVTLRPDAPSTTGLLPSPTLIEPTIAGNVNYAEAGLRPMVEIPPVRGAASDGILALRGIGPWDYAVEVSHPLKDTYVKSIRLGVIDVLGNRLHVDGPFRDTLDVVLASPAGRIEGQLVDMAQKGVDAMPVVLVPDAQHRGRRDLYRNVLTDDDGRFQFGNLPPGDYWLFAWEFIEEGSWLDSEFLRLYEDKGTPVHVDQGSREVVEVRPIPAWY
jgi:hypothetical protein